ncbi:hypothetical protein EP51_42105 (plasmid) [Rhodococcus opacus]|uniref:Uncharacterized protein n=1 Tax=Rhodococcus opacus TaxID=37919 RepID=A0A076EY90_RHOOP|nr:hypothetical protein EP51_42105 [Rhodococcus opacus]
MEQVDQLMSAGHSQCGVESTSQVFHQQRLRAHSRISGIPGEDLCRLFLLVALRTGRTVHADLPTPGPITDSV